MGEGTFRVNRTGQGSRQTFGAIFNFGNLLGGREQVRGLFDQASENFVTDCRAIGNVPAQIVEAFAATDLIEKHQSRLENNYGEKFPPPPSNPLFGTYANIRFAIDSRRQLIDWCRWMESELTSAADEVENTS